MRRRAAPRSSACSGGRPGREPHGLGSGNCEASSNSIRREHNSGRKIAEADHSLFRVFLDELRKLGHIEGHNLIIERHSGEGRFDQFPDLARKVVQTNPEVIVAITERVAHAFKVATNTIPVVTIVSDPVAQGLARSFARPAGNITGVSGYAGLETIGKYLEILKEIVPPISRIGLLAPVPRGS